MNFRNFCKQINFYKPSKQLISIIFFAIILSQLASSITIQADKPSYLKGQTVSIEGYTVGQYKKVKLFIINDSKVIVDQQIESNISGYFSLEYPIGNLDPTGLWQISATEESETQSVNINVDSSRQSQFLTVNILSPSAEKYARGQKIKLNAQVLDAGKNVEDAKVNFWDFKGERHRLVSQKNGFYTYDFDVPADANLGEFKLYVDAESFADEQTIGGEAIQQLEIVQSLITFDAIEPAFSEIRLGQQIPFKLNAFYSDGTLLGEAEAFVKIRDFKFSLARTAEDTFEGSYRPNEKDAGLLVITITVRDNLGNSAEKIVRMNVTGWLEYTISNNLIALLIIIGIIIFILFTSLESIYFNLKHKFLELRRKQMMDAKRKFQYAYFSKGSITKLTYREKLNQLDSELSKLDIDVFKTNAKLNEMRKSKITLHVLLEFFSKGIDAIIERVKRR